MYASPGMRYEYSIAIMEISGPNANNVYLCNRCFKYKTNICLAINISSC